MGNSKLVICGLLSISGIIQMCETLGRQDEEVGVVPLFVFGDSLYDVGNNNYINTTTISQANFPPYGQTFFKFPTGGRFSDGRVIPDFIGEHAKLPLILPYLYPGIKDFVKGMNFASGGAGVLNQTFPGYSCDSDAEKVRRSQNQSQSNIVINGIVKVVPLRRQVDYFKEMNRSLRKKLGTSETKKLLSRAVYLIAIGSNDYGGRKFSVLNIGPIDHLPAVQEAIISHGRTPAWLEQFKRFIVLHNQKLPKALQKLAQKFKAIYSHTDFHTAINDIIHHPTKYVAPNTRKSIEKGMKEVKSACCGIGALRGRDSCGGKRGIKE
ncbi:unnamed protein product [Citrullus colocynthis]|uniref:Uncharacterized protein n=1 Tax=Citrullus colocynthis TaxID=252529 RepID=A0ABP0XS48_9ROSI